MPFSSQMCTHFVRGLRGGGLSAVVAWKVIKITVTHGDKKHNTSQDLPLPYKALINLPLDDSMYFFC